MSGARLPHVVETDARTSGRMSRQRARDTRPELDLRSHLHAQGFRYRVHRRPLPAIRRAADLVFLGPRVAVFVDGCFWHVCPQHASWPQRNAVWWRSKLEGNRARDRETDEILTRAGWAVVRVWEHERPDEAAARVAAAVRARRFKTVTASS